METALVIALWKAEKETAEAVNAIMKRHGLPCYLMEPIICKIYRQVSEGKAAELTAAMTEQDKGAEG